ncbi:MAG: glutamate-1-semialdehyde 2,1-aminomutase [Flavobacteriales bacterium]|nr:glutamate-1-semialdehyde 2,1-aminomutase [Flavobacteriales bacterium]
MNTTGPIQNFEQGRKVLDRFHAIVPGAGHTYSKGEDQFPWNSPQLIAHAKGAYCWDVDGNKFVDWAMGNRVIILGHADDHVNAKVKEALDLGTNYTRPGMLEFELAEYLTDLFPVAEMVKYGKNGSDVTTAAIKLARAYTGKKYVAICKDHPFFSIHDWFIGTTPCDNGVLDEVRKYTLGFSYNDPASLENLISEYPNQIAAVILEPVKNDEPRDNYLQVLRDTCTKEGMVLIFDEMISGLRFDLRGAHHKYGVMPDLATFGKCISNGFSFSLLAGKKDLMELGGLRHDRKRTFLLSQTHGAESPGLVAARATLEACDRLKVSEHTWGFGAQLVSGLRKIALEEKVEKFIRIIGFDCNPQIISTRENGQYWPELHTLFHEEMISWGVLIPWISITYAHGQQELDITLNAFRHAAKRVYRCLEDNAVETAFAGDAVKPVFRTYNKCKQGRCGLLHADAPKASCCIG